MNLRNPTLKKAMLEALEKSLGIVTTACKTVGIDRSTHYEWMKNDPEYKKSVDSIEDMAIDFTESKLFQKIKGEDTACIIFYMKTKAKKLGYIEGRDITSGGEKLAPVQITVGTQEDAARLQQSVDKVTNDANN